MADRKTGKDKPIAEKAAGETMDTVKMSTAPSTAAQPQQTIGAGALDAAKTGAAASVKPTVSHMLGEVTWILSQSPAHKHFAIGDLEWLVMPAILLEQFRVFHGDKHPLGLALWAYLSEDAEARVTAAVAAGGGARLRPDDWKSGERLWLVELVAPYATPENKLTEAMVADLIQNVFGEKAFKFHSMEPATGNREVREVGG